MKKQYDTPTAEMLMFSYRDQIVAASAGDVAPANETGSNTQDFGEFLRDIFSDGFSREDIAAILQRIFG